MSKRDSTSSQGMIWTHVKDWNDSKASLKKRNKSMLDQNELKLLHESLNPYLSALEV